MKGEFDLLRSEIEVLRREMTLRLGGMLMAGFAALAALIKFVPPHL